MGKKHRQKVVNATNMILIAIVDKKWGIAKGGKQIYAIQEDLRRFRALTMGATVLMGRKTFETIGHPLAGRRNIVFSRTMHEIHAVEVVRDTINVAAVKGPIYVVGGESIYRQMLPYCSRAYITEIDADLGADQFIDRLDRKTCWEIVYHTNWKQSGNVKYRYCIYERKGDRHD